MHNDIHSIEGGIKLWMLVHNQRLLDCVHVILKLWSNLVVQTLPFTMWTLCLC